MQNQSGVFIVLEGSDGSGKSTQFEILKKRLTEAGHEVEVFDFPRYDQPSSYFITRYLNGEYGPASSVSPYTASLFYALDRYEAAPSIRKALAAGKIVLSNRFVGSNMAHQGAKFKDEVEKRSFFIWEDSIEFQLLNTPRPTMNLFMRVPAEISYELILKKAARSYTNSSRDQHEADIDHLKKAVDTYDLLCQLFPRDFQAIDCVENGRLLSVADISERLWEALQPLLPEVKTRQTAASRQLPAAENLEAAPTAAPKSQASEYDWRIPKLSYLAAIEIKSKLPELKIDQASWAGARSHYGFHVPQSLSAELSDKYKTATSSIAQAHQALHTALSSSLAAKGQSGSAGQSKASAQATIALRSATPLAAYTSAQLIIPRTEAAQMLRKLNFIQNEEVYELAKSLAEKLSELWPTLTPQTGEIVEGKAMPEAIGSIIEKLTQEISPLKARAQPEAIKLLEARPRNEFDLIADGLSSYSSLGRDEIASQISQWSYSQKVEALRAALLKSPAMLDSASYRLDYHNDWLSLLHVLELGLASDVQRQLTSPEDGYQVPAAIEEAILENAYNDLFAASQETYRTLQAEHDGRTLEYASLLGHRLHWQLELNAASLGKLGATAAQRSLFQPLQKIVEAVHPTVASFIKSTAGPSQQPLRQGSKPKPQRRHSKKK